MKRRLKYCVIVAVVLLVALTGCALASGFYADEESEVVTDESIVQGEPKLTEELNNIGKDEYEEWVNEKLYSGELVDLTGGSNVSAYGTPGTGIVTDQSLIDKAYELLEKNGLLQR